MFGEFTNQETMRKSMKANFQNVNAIGVIVSQGISMLSCESEEGSIWSPLLIMYIQIRIFLEDIFGLYLK